MRAAPLFLLLLLCISLLLLASGAVAAPNEAKERVARAVVELKEGRRDQALAEMRAASKAEGEFRLSAADLVLLAAVADEEPVALLLKRGGTGDVWLVAFDSAESSVRGGLLALLPRLADPAPGLARLARAVHTAEGAEAAAAMRAFGVIAWRDRALDDETFQHLFEAAKGHGGASDAIRRALDEAALDGAQRSLLKEVLPTSVEPPDARNPLSDLGPGAAEPRVVKVYYGTDRAESRPAWRDYGKRLLPGLALFLLAPLLARFLGWLLHHRFAGLVRWSRWAALVAGALLLVFAAYHGVRTHQRIARLGFDYGPDRGPFNQIDKTGVYCYLGSCLVGIPPRHEIGEVERPGLLSGKLWEDPEEHVMILRIEPLEKEKFFGELKVAGEERAFVFVHGFNVRFEDAALRTAQIAHDLEFEGAPIFFSWPSRAEVLAYTVDESTVAWATHHLKLFLRDVRRALPTATIHLVAHSMGNRALTEALRSLSGEIGVSLSPFQEVILAAPDIDGATFRDDIVPALRPTAERVTLYCAANDSALEVSRQIHGYPRAGDSSGGVFVAEGIETVDVALKDRDVLGHSYYGSVGRVLEDIVSLLLHRKRPEERGLVQVGSFWRLTE